MRESLINADILSRAIELLQNARQSIVRHINTTMISTYFEIGQMIIEQEQAGAKRAQYGKGLIKELSIALTNEFGKGFSPDNLENMRRFYLAYGNSETVSRKLEYQKTERASRQFILSWSHYVKLIRIESEPERKFYQTQCAENNWSVRELSRQCNSALYQRLAISRKKDPIVRQSESEAVVEFTLPENNEQIFASKYKTILPSKDELKSVINN
ncbi:MAG: hypothetical protein ACI865_001272 [Flavobacteriaceae bacterium]|jgi:hypothetical protein